MFQRPHPLIVELAEGHQRLCTCWESDDPPFCDRTQGPLCERALEVVVERSRTAAICACGDSRKRPWCDGSHGYG